MYSSMTKTCEHLDALITNFMIVGKSISGRMITITDYDLKLFFAREIHTHIGAALRLAQRWEEIRQKPYRRSRGESASCLRLASAWMQLPSDEEFALSYSSLIVPKTRELLDAYSRRSDPVLDAPTLQVLRHIRCDIDDGMSELGSLPFQLVISDHSQRSLDQIRQILTGCDLDSIHASSLRDDRSSLSSVYSRPTKCSRDPRFDTFNHTRDYTDLLKFIPKTNCKIDDDVLEVLWTQRDEIDALETFANVLFELDTDDVSISALLGRFIWDESRHSAAGHRAFKDMGVDPFNIPCGTIGIDIRSSMSPEVAFGQINLIGERNIVRRIKSAADKCTTDENRFIGQALEFIFCDERMHVRVGRSIIKSFPSFTSEQDLKSTSRNLSNTKLKEIGVKQQDYIESMSDAEFIALLGE